MRCAWIQERLLPYLAGELRGWQAARIARHLERCDACTEQAALLAAAEEQAEAALRVDAGAPERLDARVMEAVRRLPAPRRSWIPELPWSLVRPGWGMALAALCFLALGFGSGRWSALHGPVPTASSTALDFGAFGEAHRRLLAIGNAPEVETAAPAELGRRLTPLVRFPVSPVDLGPEKTRLVGGSREVVQGAPVACLHYEWQGERLSLFQVDARRLSPAALRQVSSRAESYVAQRRGGLSCVAWTSGGVSCVLVSHAMPMHQLFQLACHACERQERLPRRAASG